MMPASVMAGARLGRCDREVAASPLAGAGLAVFYAGVRFVV